MTPPLNRRDFLATAAAGAALATSTGLASAGVAAPLFPRAELPKSATARRILGQSKVEVSLVGMGTGSVGSSC